MERLKKILASALLVCMLVSMLPVSALAEDEVCAHSETYVETVSRGCTTAGSNTTKCSACGTPLGIETIPATGVHTAGEPVTVAASCTAEGSTTVSCTACGVVLSTNVILAPGHSFSDATCTVPKTCKVCTATEGEPLGHDYAPATCTAPKTCKVCTATEGEPTGHTAGETVTVDATCTDDGSITVKCTVCGEAASTETIPATGHTAGEETVITKATCIAEGSKSVKCTVCGETYTAIIPATGVHIEGAHTVTKEATCEEAGEETISCATEGCEYSETVEIPALGHKYNEQHECSVCGEKELLLTMTPPQSVGLAITGESTINKGATTKLDANDTVTWTSSDSTVAEVNVDGVVKGIKGGNVTITATDENNNEVTHSIHVHEYAWDTTVSAQGSHQKKCSVEECPTPIIENAAHSFIYDDTNGYFCETCEYVLGKPQITRTDGTSPVAVGGYFELGYSNIPQGVDVTWEYNADELSAEPSDFSTRFTAKEAGDLTISLKADGETVASYTQNVLANGVPATATITVVEKTLQITGGNTKLAKDATLNLSVTVTPDTNESTPIEWTSSDPDIATVDEDGKVTGKAKGTATITATANDNSGASASVKVYVYEDNTGYIAVEKDLIEVGESIEVRLVHPAVGDMDSVTWSVNDENVAAINGEG